MIVGLPLKEYVSSLPPGYFVARTRYTPGKSRWTETKLEFFEDREGFIGEMSDDAKKELIRWINKTAVNRLRKELYLNNVSTGDTRLIAINDAPFFLYADPRASYGYIYLAAWKEAACPSPTKSSEQPTSRLEV